MAKINQQELSKFLSEIHCFVYSRHLFAEQYGIEAIKDPHRGVLMPEPAKQVEVNNIKFRFVERVILSIQIGDKNIDLKNVEDDEMELISHQFAFLDQIRELKIAEEDALHRHNVQKSLEKVNQNLEKLPTENKSEHFKTLMQSPTQREIAQAIQKEKEEQAELKKFHEELNNRAETRRKNDEWCKKQIEETIFKNHKEEQERRDRNQNLHWRERDRLEWEHEEEEEAQKDLVVQEEDTNEIARIEDESSFIVKVLSGFFQWSPITNPGLFALIIAMIPSLYFFGPFGLLLYFFLGPLICHVVDTILYVCDKEDEKQKVLDMEHYVAIEEKPGPKTYDEHIAEEDDELTRKIEALPKATE